MAGREALGFDAVTLRDLQRYMGLLGAKVAGPHGVPWRQASAPMGRAR